MPTTKLAIITLTALSVISCGGEGNSTGDIENIVNGLSTEDNGQESDSGLLPNFAISNFVGSSDYFDSYDFIATITNTGEGKGEIPGNVLFLQASTPEFSAGTTKRRVNIRRSDDSYSNIIEPGESVVIEGSMGTGNGFLYWDTMYNQIWLNPDYGLATFGTSGLSDRYDSRYEIAESNYDDNKSDVIELTTRVLREPRCIEKDFENNDSIETAQLIELGVEYESTLCMDTADLFSIALDSGSFYELASTGFDFTSNIGMRILVIDPDGEYLVDDTLIKALFSPLKDGLHTIVITKHDSIGHDYDDEGTFTVNKR